MVVAVWLGVGDGGFANVGFREQCKLGGGRMSWTSATRQNLESDRLHFLFEPHSLLLVCGTDRWADNRCPAKTDHVRPVRSVRHLVAGQGYGG